MLNKDEFGNREFSNKILLSAISKTNYTAVVTKENI